MKKLTAILLAMLILLTVTGTGIFAFAADTAEVYVTIRDNSGTLRLVQKAVEVTDTDNDGALTVKDALYIAHERFYEGGAAAGYDATYSLLYGWSLSKLWGQTNSGSFGYYINNGSAWSLTDTVEAGDYLYAFCYTDSQNFSDCYSFFDKDIAEITQYESTQLTLNYYTYDYTTWELLTVPLANAEILLDGETTGIFTDENGKATIEFTDAGEFTVSAQSADKLIISPVCTVKVADASLWAKIAHFFRMILDFFKNIFNA